MNNTSNNHTHDSSAVDTLPMPLPEYIDDLFAKLVPHDVEQFYQIYQFWMLQRRIETLQLQIDALKGHIEQNAEFMQQVHPSAISLAALARLQASGVEDIALLDKMLERGEMWLDQTIQLLDQCEHLDLIHGNYTEWCEHALEGAYNWLHTFREAGTAPKTPTVEKDTTDETAFAEPVATETQLLRKLISDEEDVEEDADKTIQLPVIALAHAVYQPEEALSPVAPNPTTVEVEEEEVPAPLADAPESEATADEEQAPSLVEAEVAEGAEAATITDSAAEAQPEMAVDTAATPLEATVTSEDSSNDVEVSATAADALQESEPSAIHIDTEAFETAETAAIASSAPSLPELDEQDIISVSSEQDELSEDENPNIEMPAIRITAPLPPAELLDETAPLEVEQALPHAEEEPTLTVSSPRTDNPLRLSEQHTDEEPSAEAVTADLPDSHAEEEPPAAVVPAVTPDSPDSNVDEDGSAVTAPDEPAAEEGLTAVEVPIEAIGEPEASVAPAESISETTPTIETPALSADEPVEHTAETASEVAAVKTDEPVIVEEVSTAELRSSEDETSDAAEPGPAEDNRDETAESDSSKDEFDDYEQITLTNLPALKPTQQEDAAPKSVEAEVTSPPPDQTAPEMVETAQDAPDVTATSQEAANDTADITDAPTATIEETTIAEDSHEDEPIAIAAAPTDHTLQATAPQPVIVEVSAFTSTEEHYKQETAAAAQTAASLPTYQFSPLSQPGTEEASPVSAGTASWQWKDLASYEQSLAAAPTAPHPIVRWPAEPVEEQQPPKKRGFFQWLKSLFSGQD